MGARGVDERDEPAFGAGPRPLVDEARAAGFQLRELVSHRFMDHLERAVLAKGELGAIVDRVAAREIDPYTAANELLARAGLR